ncbi:hypothetical protein [Streptomyces sp. NPDC051132]|uniref:hypothetical protein n=1 Tax=unclassified Streptomyces TaxID=2593676 RepID=UPI00342500A4
MDALNQLNVIGLVLSAVLVAMACVKADWVRSWRANVNPSAPELPGSAFVTARVLFLGLAAIGVYLAVQGFGVSDDGSWSDDELSSAVRHATDDLDGFMFRTDQGDNPDSFTDYASLVQDRVIEAGGGDAPEFGVAVEPAEGNTAADASLTITADGTDAEFCARLRRVRSKKDDYTPPGITGGQGTITYQAYRLRTSVREGGC